MSAQLIQTPPAQWRQHMETHKAFAERAIIEHQKLRQTLIVHGETGLSVMLLEYSNAEERDGALYLAGLLITAENASGICLLAEAWITFPTMIAWPVREKKRREAVIVNLFYREDGEKFALSSLREIIRDADGKVTGLSAELNPPVDQPLCMTDAFAELLPDKPISREMMRYAAEQFAQLILPESA